MPSRPELGMGDLKGNEGSFSTRRKKCVSNSRQTQNECAFLDTVMNLLSGVRSSTRRSLVTPGCNPPLDSHEAEMGRTILSGLEDSAIDRTVA